METFKKVGTSYYKNDFLQIGFVFARKMIMFMGLDLVSLLQPIQADCFESQKGIYVLISNIYVTYVFT